MAEHRTAYMVAIIGAVATIASAVITVFLTQMFDDDGNIPASAPALAEVAWTPMLTTAVLPATATGIADPTPSATVEPTETPRPTNTPAPTAAATATATHTATATSTPPAPGTVLYLADASGGFPDWPLDEVWSYQNGSLRFGPRDSDSHSIVAPYEMPGLERFAIEVEFKQNCINIAQEFGVLATGKGTRGIWSGVFQSDGRLIAIWDGEDRERDARIATDEAPDLAADQRHIMRLEVEGDVVRLVIDQRTVMESVIDQPLAAYRVGLWGVSCPNTVARFEVVAL